MSPRYLLPLALLASACTTLGPMPATTGVSAVPVDRPGAEVSTGVAPAYFLSEAAQKRTDGDNLTQATGQMSAILEPDRWFGTKGLILGARKWGEDGDQGFEPMIGMRRHLDERFAIAGIAYGTRLHGEQSDASYEATHVGGELAFDYAILPIASWLAIHLQASVSATYLDAAGTYCVGSDGDAIDCDDHSRRVDGTISGLYTAATAGLSIDIARRPHGIIHDVRLAAVTAFGGMPRIRDGVQERSDDTYKSFGFSLTVGVGEN